MVICGLQQFVHFFKRVFGTHVITCGICHINWHFVYGFFVIPKDSIVHCNVWPLVFHIDLSPRQVDYELYVFKYHNRKFTKLTDRLSQYEAFVDSAHKDDFQFFHPPISSLVEDRTKWFRSQIQFLRGNELPMCWTNYDLVIRYQ